jgi:SAM-dependent methyltransferase
MKDKISKQIAEAELNIQKGNSKEAQQNLYQALGIAAKVQDFKSVEKIMGMLREMGLNLINPQSIELGPLETDGFTLDIGGGGEGIIGKLKGTDVIAIDISERELSETQNEALKVVMNATELRFLPKSFQMCTAFFSLMYIPKSEHSKVFQEVHRVLKEKGRFLIWDVRIPVAEGTFEQFIVPLKIKIPGEIIETGYGVKWQVQDMEHFKQLAQETGFTVSEEWSRDEIFHLDLRKRNKP